MNETKFCGLCKKELPLTPEYFWKFSRSPDGYQYRCKHCQNFNGVGGGRYERTTRNSENGANFVIEEKKRIGQAAERVNGAIRKALRAEIEELNDLVPEEFRIKLAEDAHHFRVVWEAGGRHGRKPGGQKLFYLDEEGDIEP